MAVRPPEEPEVPKMSVHHISDDLWRAMPDGNEKRQAYYCSRECGHAWNLVIQQHKGTDYVRIEIRKDPVRIDDV
jgi:hypothetical protein